VDETVPCAGLDEPHAGFVKELRDIRIVLCQGSVR
jgi:hypothetical protein